MSDLRKAAQQALEALDALAIWDRDLARKSITALRQALEAERQEPAEFYDWWTLRPSLTRLQAYLLWREEVNAEIGQSLEVEQPVAFEFYNPETGHAIVDYNEQTHVGRLSREMGYIARPLYTQPQQPLTDEHKAEQQVEPVAWMYDTSWEDGTDLKDWVTTSHPKDVTLESEGVRNIRPLYTHPQPAQQPLEPVAYFYTRSGRIVSTEASQQLMEQMTGEPGRIALYSAPQPVQQPLTEEQILDLSDPFGAFEYGDAQGHKRKEFARAIERAHGIGGEV
jgi:hypothetical protein